MLDASGVPVEPKPFAMGVRIEHRRRNIDICPIRRRKPRPAPADYKLVEHLDRETVCIPSACVRADMWWRQPARRPGGHRHELCRPGPEKKRQRGTAGDGESADFPTRGNLGGMRAGSGRSKTPTASAAASTAPRHKSGGFLAGRPSDRAGRVTPTYRPGVTWCDLHDVLPGKDHRRHCPGAAPAGREAERLCRPGRGDDRAGDPQFFPGANYSGFLPAVFPSGAVPHGRGRGLRRGHHVRGHRRHYDGGDNHYGGKL